MGDKTAIEWTSTHHADGTVTPGATWNPVTGCTKVSPACAHCYIERTPPFRMAGRKFVKGHIPLELHENRLDQPLRWKRPRRIFVNSLSDLFHEDIDPLFVGRVFNVMGEAHWHTFQVLTKRADRMLDIVRAYYAATGGTPYPNVWLGHSVENQPFADERIWQLLRTPAAVRFISAEPLLGDLNLRDLRPGRHQRETAPLQPVLGWPVYDALRGEMTRGRLGYDMPKLDWVIGGAESGPGFRETRIEWARHLRDQCVEAGVPFLWKQNGGLTPKSRGRELDGRTWDEYPTVVAA